MISEVDTKFNLELQKQTQIINNLDSEVDLDSNLTKFKSEILSLVESKLNIVAPAITQFNTRTPQVSTKTRPDNYPTK